LCPESLLVRNNTGELPIHVAGLHNDVNTTCKMLEKSPHLIYETTAAGKSTLDMFEKACDMHKMELISCVFRTGVELRQSFWNFIPRPLYGVGDIFLYLDQDARTKMFHHLTRKARKKIQNMYLLVSTYEKSRGIRIEKEIVDKIILTSVINNPPMEDIRANFTTL